MKAIFKISALLLLLNSCVQLVQEGLDSTETEVVLNGILQPDTAPWVHLSYTSAFTKADFKYIANARVVLYEDGEFFEELIYQSEGYYSGEKITKAGAFYECEVEIPGYGQLNAADLIPNTIHFANEKTDYGTPNDEGVAQPRVNLDIQHDPNKPSYFDLGIFIYDSGNGLRQAQTVIPFDRVILDEGIETPVFSNNTMTETPYSFQAHLFVNQFGCSDVGCSARIFPTIIELRTVSYHLYRYLQQAYLQEQAGIPEFGIGMPPPITSYSNVENGRGIFAAYAYMRSDTIPPPPRPF